MVSSNNQSGTVTESARQLQDRIHRLLSKLAETAEHIKKWPEAKGDDASIHVESTSQLITKIRNVIKCLQKVESSLQDDAVLRETLQKCLIPLDLLDLLDSSKINPDCFTRGLLREALGQLAGLQRRKLALELLGSAVESGIKKRQLASTDVETSSIKKEDLTSKRDRDEGAVSSAVGFSPPSKKAKSEL